MEKIFEHANDLHVRNYVFYGKTADSKLYYEPEYTNQVDKADLENAFKKGLVIVEGANYLVPVLLAGNKVSTIKETGSGEPKTLSFVAWMAKA